jgi:hypothetical protein
LPNQPEMHKDVGFAGAAHNYERLGLNKEDDIQTCSYLQSLGYRQCDESILQEIVRLQMG